MMGFDIDRVAGPMRIRAWLLIVNFLFNAVGLYGLSRVMVQGTGWFFLGFGVVGTLACIILLSQPSER